MRCSFGLGIVLSIGFATVSGAPALANTWTVDAACPDALVDPADTAPPFCTIGRGALAAVPGDTVLVLPGDYREQVTPTESGSAGLPIRFIAAGQGARVLGTIDVSDPGGWSATATNAWSRLFTPSAAPRQVFLDGTRLADAPSATTTTPGTWFYEAATDLLYVDVGGPNPGIDHVVEAGARTHGFNLEGLSDLEVEGFEITGQNTNGLRIATCGQIVARGNIVSYTGSRGINVQDATGPITIDGNEVSFANGIGIRVAGSAGVVLAGNHSHDNANHGISLTGSSGNTIWGNVVHHNAVPGGVSAVGVDVSTGSSSNIIRANTAFQNQDSGFEVDDGSNSNLFVRNISSANGDHGFDARGSNGARFVSNTAYGNGVDGFSVENTASDTQLSNNISVDSGRFELFVPNPLGGFASDYDLLWKSGAGSVVRFGAATHVTLDAFRLATGQETHGVGADPRFVDAAAGDLRLRLGPAVDAADAGAPGFVLEDHDGAPPLDIPAIPDTGAGDPPYADIGAIEYADEPPNAHLAVTPSGRPAPVLVTADASKSRDDVGIASYRFDFGDGAVAGPQASAVATHTYTSPGNYRVTVTVTDEAGFTTNHSKNLHVSKPK